MLPHVTEFVSRRWSVPRESFRVEVQCVPGGLESAVTRARILQHGACSAVPPGFVVKQVADGLEREADVYDLLWRHFDTPPAVRLLGREVAGGSTYLYLEDAASADTWPWSDTRRAGAVCRALARLHDSRALPRETFAWDYESELACSAAATLALAREARNRSGERSWRRFGDLRRVVGCLSRIRRQLLGRATSVIHGDMHPGNVFLRDGTDPEVVFIDWARARIGSPLEDVASWLHSLGCWEPQARLRHDTLMRMYLDARRTRQAFDADIRHQYWLASASNGLSGAIRYHLAVLSDPAASDQARRDSDWALAAWQRVIKRAASLLGTSAGRCT